MRYYESGPKIGDFNIWGISEIERPNVPLEYFAERGVRCFLRVATVIDGKEHIGCVGGQDITDALINLFSCKKEIVSAKEFMKKSA